MPKEIEKQTEYTFQLQKLFLELMLHDSECFVRVQNIFNSENFDSKLKDVAELISTHSTKFNALPDIKQVSALTSVKLDNIPNDLDDAYVDWFMVEFEGFTKRQELERAILKSADLLEKGNYGPVEKLIKDAVQISLTKDMGTDYFEDPRKRLEAIRDNKGQTSTGYVSLDHALFGGFNLGELNLLAGGSGSGKSLVMQNFTLNWIESGLNGIFLSLELSEDLCSMRVDGMLADIPSRNVLKNIDDVELKIKMKSKACGDLQIKYMPAQSNVNDIRSYIKELQIKTGNKLNFICVDYLDLLMPVSVKVDPSDSFTTSKYVSEELRNLAKELDILMLTASQLNRCLLLDTKVIANGKEIEIKDVKVGDYLESNEGNVQVYEKLPITTQPVYKITTKSGKIISCSANHKFPTTKGEQTLNTGLKIGDKLYIKD